MSSNMPIILTEGLIANIHVPQIDSQIVRRNKCFAVAIESNGVDVVRVNSFKYLFDTIN